MSEAGAMPHIRPDDPARPEVRVLREAHLEDMVATSPPESRHALDVDGLRAADVSFYSLQLGGAVVGCGALRVIAPGHGELKSMRTVETHRGRGLAARMLVHLVEEARRRALRRLSLETGSQAFFAPARRLYARHGFEVCGPFGSYVEDPNSVFMTRTIS